MLDITARLRENLSPASRRASSTPRDTGQSAGKSISFPSYMRPSKLDNLALDLSVTLDTDYGPEPATLKARALQLADEIGRDELLRQINGLEGDFGHIDVTTVRTNLRGLLDAE